MIKFILLSLSVYVATSVSYPDQQYIDVNVAKSAKIDKSVTIKSHSQIGEFVNISGPTTIGEYCRVKDYVNISAGGIIGNSVNILNNVNVKLGVRIGNHSHIDKHVTLGRNVTIMNKVTVKKFANIGNGAEIKDHSLIDENSSIGANMKVAQKVYIGINGTIPPKAIVNELAIIHVNVDLPNGYTVKKNEVVIRSPSSYELYRNCTSSDRIPKEQVQIANTRGSRPSKPFNDMMRKLLDPEINNVRRKCEQRKTITKPDMSAAKSLFLIQRYGLDRFNQSYKQVKLGQNKKVPITTDRNGDTIINGTRIPCEYHFGSNGERDIFESDVKKKFIQLLEIEIDADRFNRVLNDTFCNTTAQILKGEREVTVAIPTYRGIANSVHYSSFFLILSTLLTAFNWT